MRAAILAMTEIKQQLSRQHMHQQQTNVVIVMEPYRSYRL